MTDGPDNLPVRDDDPALVEARQLALDLGERAEWDRVHAEAQAAGIYTGTAFRERQPAKYKVATQLLAAGVGVLKIAALLRVSHHTVAAVRDGIGRDSVAREKAILSDQMRLAVRLLMERAVNEIEAIDLDKIPFWIGVLTDKLQLLDGQATARIETTAAAGMSLEAFRAYVEALPVVESAPAASPGEAPAGLVVDHPAGDASKPEGEVDARD